MRCRQTMVHGRAVHGKRRAQVCKAGDWDDGCIAWNGTRGMLGRPRNRETTVGQQQVAM